MLNLISGEDGDWLTVIRECSNAKENRLFKKVGFRNSIGSACVDVNLNRPD